MAVTNLPDHLEIEHGALINTLSFDQLTLLFKLFVPMFQLGLNAMQRLLASLGQMPSLEISSRKTPAKRSGIPSAKNFRGLMEKAPAPPFAKGSRSKRFICK